MTACYFDDFVVLGSEAESKTLASCVQLVLRILGWRFAESGSKAPDLSEVFSALGIRVDITNMHMGRVLLDNTESRKRELVLAIDNIIESGTLKRADALKFRGRLQFSSAQVFGRIAKSAPNGITQHAYHGSGDTISEELKFTLLLRKHFLQSGEPRKVRPMSMGAYYYFTDACFEWKDDKMFSGIGAVVCDANGKKLCFFSSQLPPSLLEQLEINPDKKQTIIYECEFLAVFTAMLVWGSVFGPATVFLCRQQCSS